MEENQLLPDVQEPADAEPPQTDIAGFWRRLLAFIIDMVILTIPLFILGFAVREAAFALGPWGRIIGYVLVVSYWAYCHSGNRAGQTIGKQITGIAVVDEKNRPIGLGRSFLRAAILGLIFVLNGWALAILDVPLIAMLTTVIVFGGTLALIYGLVFNRTTRQGIHDLLVGSYVIKTPPNPDAVTPPLPRIHRRMTIGLLGVGLLVGVGGLLVGQNQSIPGVVEAGEMAEMQELQSVLMAEGAFFSVSVNRVDRRTIGNQSVLRDLNIEIWAKRSCRLDPDYCDDLVMRVAETAFAQYDNIESLSGMRIAIVNQFDFGLARGNYVRGIAWSIADWRNALAGEATGYRR